MRIVISDSSCLIDLRKASLLDAFLRLPYEVLIPNTLFEDELLKFTAAQKKALVRGGLKVVDLPGDSVLRARQIARDMPHLSINDGFAFALAESCRGCILLTGDGALRALAQKQEIEVHGVLWVKRAHDTARRMRDEGATVISGFHSPIEKECLRILLRGKQPIIICPARAIESMRIPAECRAAYEAGRILGQTERMAEMLKRWGVIEFSARRSR